MPLRQSFLLFVIVIITGNMLLAACGDNPQPVPPIIAPTNAITPITAIASSTAIVVPTPTTQPGTIAPLGTPTQAGTQSAGAVYVYYFKDDSLWSVKPDGTNLHKIVDKVYSYTRVGFNQLVVVQQVDDVLQLKLIQLSGGLPTGETVLDSKTYVFTKDPLPPGYFTDDTEAIGKIAVSPDGSQVVYTKENLAGTPIYGTPANGHMPSELWIANLNPANPAAKVFVPNNKGYVTFPQWSPDGNRVLFIRTRDFGTGGGYPTALWSVYKDGSRLSFLTGPDLGTIAGNKYTLQRTSNLRWISPTSISFTSEYIGTDILWVHDLTIGSDFPRPIAFDVAYNDIKFCDSVRRFVYIKQDKNSVFSNSLYSVESDTPGANGQLPSVTNVGMDGGKLYDCVGANVLYADTKGQLSLQRLSFGGIFVGPRITLGKPIDLKKNQVGVKLSPDGKFTAVYTYPTLSASYPSEISLYLYGEYGSPIGLSGSVGELEPFRAEWVGEKTLAVIGSDSTQKFRLLIVDFNSGVPIIRSVDNSKDNMEIVLPSSGQQS